MMITTLAVAARDRGRLKEMVTVASRFGLGVLAGELGLQEFANAERTDGNGASLPRRVRLALEELGPTFVKLGQILATRVDLLPSEWVAELEQLQSRAPTLPFTELRPSVEAALGMPPEEAFSSFDVVPLAAASMAQVHRATLQDGTEVVVKVQRPGIRPRVEADVRLLTQLASVVERANTAARRFQPTALVRQLADGLLEELDFTQEGRNAVRMQADFADERRIVIPNIHWDFTSPCLLVMDYVTGVAPRDAAVLRDAGIDPARIADLGANMVLDMVLVNGRFHGDPHPGNLLCLPGNRIALLDFGMVGHVSPRRREEFLAFAQGITTGDAALLADVLGAWSTGGGASREAVTRASDRLVAAHSGGRLVIGPLVKDFLTLMREEGLTMPPDLMLMFKALLTMDGVLTAIQPDFDLSGPMHRAMLKVAWTHLSPDHWVPIVRALGVELARIGDDAPRLLRNAVERLGASPARESRPDPHSNAKGSRLIAAAVLVSGALISTAILLS